jgi:hypothetical protein
MFWYIKLTIQHKEKGGNYRGIGLLNACYELYSKFLNEKLKAQAEKFLL